MAVIKARTIFNRKFEATELQIKNIYKAWSTGAINIPAEEKPSYFFNHFIISGIDFIKFKTLVTGGQNYEIF